MKIDKTLTQTMAICSPVNVEWREKMAELRDGKKKSEGQTGERE